MNSILSIGGDLRIYLDGAVCGSREEKLVVQDAEAQDRALVA